MRIMKDVRIFKLFSKQIYFINILMDSCIQHEYIFVRHYVINRFNYSKYSCVFIYLEVRDTDTDREKGREGDTSAEAGNQEFQSALPFV